MADKAEIEKPNETKRLTLWVQVRVAALTVPAVNQAIDLARRVIDELDDQPHEAWPNGDPVILTDSSGDPVGKGAVLYMPKVIGSREV